jgi:hypothetical protein
VRRYGIVVVVVAAACGRIGFPIVDGGTPAPPTLIASGAAYTEVAGQAPNKVLSFQLTIPPGDGVMDNRFLLVAIGVSTSCGDPSRTVSVESVTYGKPLGPIVEILGTPCNLMATRSALWGLASPDAGTADVVITLGGSMPAIHGGAVVLAGVDLADPVRASVTGADSGSGALLSVSSDPGDLVVSYFGHGWTIDSPGAGQSKVFIQRGSTMYTLDNSSMSTAPGAAPSVTMDWNAGVMDQWQMIAASMRPASPPPHRL